MRRAPYPLRDCVQGVEGIIGMALFGLRTGRTNFSTAARLAAGVVMPARIPMREIPTVTSVTLHASNGTRFPQNNSAVPDTRVDDLRAASVKKWRFGCFFDARGPPDQVAAIGGSFCRMSP